MWRRLKRMVQSNLGRLSPGGGTAADTLRRQADDMARGMPALDANLAMVRAEVTLSEEKLRRLHRRDEELVALMAAAQARGSVERAAEYTTELASVRRDVGQVEAHLARARAAVEAAGRAKDAMRAARERKLEEAREVAKNLAELERDDARVASPGHELDPSPAEAASPERPVVAPPVEGLRAPAAKTLGPESPAAGTAASTEAPRDPAGKTLGPDPAAPVATVAPSTKTFGPSPPVAPVAPVAPPPSPPGAASRPLEIKVRAIGVGHGGQSIAPGRAAEPTARAADPVETPPAPAPPAEGATDLVSELERLGRLRAAGALTDEELALAKKRLLGGGSPRGAS